MLKIRIDTKNHAFYCYDEGRWDPGPQLATLLRELATRLEKSSGPAEGTLHDWNGNHVGEWRLTRR